MQFSDSERAIFDFHDGTKVVKADPLVLRRRLLQASGGDFDDLLARGWPPRAAPDAPLPPEAGIAPEVLARQKEQREQRRAKEAVAPAAPPSGDPGSRAMLQAKYDAQEKVVLCVRQVFAMPAVDPATGKGCTEAMCLAVLGAFLDFLAGERKPAGKTATS